MMQPTGKIYSYKGLLLANPAKNTFTKPISSNIPYIKGHFQQQIAPSVDLGSHMTELSIKQQQNSTKQTSKISYLEGVRGLAAFMVVIHHYLLAFYPSIFDGNPSQLHLFNFELWTYNSPLVFLINGKLYVYIFFILSGFVLSKKSFINADMSYLNSAFVRRFPRLFIPVGFALLVSFIIIKLNFYYHIELSTITKSTWLGGLVADKSIFYFTKNFIYRAAIFGDSSYINVLWTISIEFYGSLLVFAILALTSKIKNSMFILLLTLFILLLFKQFEYGAFIMGICINHILLIKIDNKLYQKIILFLLLFIGLFLGGVPSKPFNLENLSNSIYSFINYKSIREISGLLNCIGAFCIIIVVLKSKVLQRLFSTSPLNFLGEISFSMYLLHSIVLQSFSSYAFIVFKPYLDYNLLFIIVLCLSLVLIFITAYLMTKYIDKSSMSLSAKIYKRFFSKEIYVKLQALK